MTVECEFVIFFSISICGSLSAEKVQSVFGPDKSVKMEECAMNV